MQEHQERVIAEKEDLKDKIAKLNMFIKNVECGNIPIEAIDGEHKGFMLLKDQYSAMTTYLKVLSDRIMLFDTKETNQSPFLICSYMEKHNFKVGDKVIKNEETWEPNDLDNWGRGIGIGIIVEPPFEMDNGEVDVKWPNGKCFEFTNQLIKL